MKYFLCIEHVRIYNLHSDTDNSLTSFFEDILALSRLSGTKETIKIELSKNHYSTTNYHFLHFYIEMKLNHMLR